jgi:hypothetical protein
MTRRCFQFRLRTLLLVVTIVGVWTPLVMNLTEAVHAAREAARSTPCLNNVRAPGGARFISPPAATATRS